MAGIYIHIPFCRQKCHYCNFHFSVSLKNKDALMESILKEIEMTTGFLGTHRLDTVYFGGGTPSLMSPEILISILQQVQKHYAINPDAEITLEANPDDLDTGYLSKLGEAGFNRISLGVQSFIDGELQLMNRTHDSRQARRALQLILDSGIPDVTIDLIFGMPDSTMDSWKYNLEEALKFGIPHLSCYNLTVEKRTTLDHFIRTGKIRSLEEEQMANQFLYTMDFLGQSGYEHYEISNYALPGRYARHNTSYWQGAPYLGVGPSAHSYDGRIRTWNIANNPKYIASIQAGKVPSEMEVLSVTDRFNEYIMTGMRTQWGCDLQVVSAFGPAYASHFLEEVSKVIDQGKVLRSGDQFTLTRSGKLFADEVAAAMFVDE